MQGDGNLVIYDGNYPAWASGSNGRGNGPYKLTVQDDGELYLSGGGGSQGVWQAGTRYQGANCGTVTGQIQSSSTGNAITNAKNVSVSFRNTSTGAVTNANVSGTNYSVLVLQGTYAITAKADRYTDKSDTVGVVGDTTKNIQLTPKDPNVKFTLSWATAPKDLDLELTNKSNGDRINYKNQSAGKMTINADDQNGNGPEIITLAPGTSDIYQAVVKRFSQESTFVGSNAKVEVVREGESVKTMTLPTTADSHTQAWNVLTYNAATGEIKEINTLSTDM